MKGLMLFSGNLCKHLTVGIFFDRFYNRVLLVDEFDFEKDHYVVGAVIEGETINDDGRYIYRSVMNGDDFTVEKIKKEFDYRRIAEAYMAMEDDTEENGSEE